MDQKIKQATPMGIKGLHTLSVCDVRAQGAKEAQDAIICFSTQQEAKIKGVRQQLYAIKSALLDGERCELLDSLAFWRTELRKLSEEKHHILTQMYAYLREIGGVSMLTVPNIIPTAGRAVLARWIIGDNTYDADSGANYGSLGTSATAPVNGDTQLTAESYRKATSSVARSNNIATLSNFYTATEVTGTFEEAGWHIAGTGSANTGQLLSHFLTTTIVKSSTETLTVESVLTIS